MVGFAMSSIAKMSTYQLRTTFQQVHFTSMGIPHNLAPNLNLIFFLRGIRSKIRIKIKKENPKK